MGITGQKNETDNDLNMLRGIINSTKINWLLSNWNMENPKTDS